MRRRTFVTLLGGAAAWPLLLPLATRAQQRGRPPTIGLLGAISATGFAKQLAGFRQGLRDLGYTEGENLMIEYRWAEGDYARLPALVTELVRSNVAVIVTHGTPGYTCRQAYDHHNSHSSGNNRRPHFNWRRQQHCAARWQYHWAELLQPGAPGEAD